MIEYRSLRKEYTSRNGRALAVDDVSIRIDEGSLCVLLGPSDCGKTTLLRMTNRRVEPTSGTILICYAGLLKGGGGLGDLIFSGIALFRAEAIPADAIPVTIPALMADWILGKIEGRIARR